jgi:phage tail-like protein
MAMADAILGESYPMVGFYFSLSFSNIFNMVDSKFKEVSGISMTLSVKTVQAGGDNGYEITLPEKTTFTDLTLKRGLLSTTSALTSWCYSWLLNDYSQKIEKKDVFLFLLNQYGAPVMVWQFLGAFPIKLEIGNFSSMATGDAAILVETIVLRYSNIKIVSF